MAYINDEEKILSTITLPGGDNYQIADEGARQIIANLASVAYTGSYSDLIDKPIYYRTTEEWNNDPSFAAEKSSICIYSDYKTIIDEGVQKIISGIKIADGNNPIVSLPFITEYLEIKIDGFDIRLQQLEETVNNHINDTNVHILNGEREFWNNKINVGDTTTAGLLILNRN